MPPALRAHVIIPVFRGAYAPRYEYAAPVGALFSLIPLSIFMPPLSGLCFHSSPSLYSCRPCRGSVFTHPPLYIHAAPVGALFSAVNSAESPDPALRIHRSLWWGFIVVIELKLRNHWDILCFLLAK